MKRLYKKMKKVADYKNLLSLCNSDEVLSAALCRKLLWFICSIILEKEIDYKQMSSLVPVPEEPFKELKYGRDVISVADLITSEQQLEELYYCYRSDVLEDTFISDFKGKHWQITTWENTVMLCDGYEFYHFKDFYKELSDTTSTVTPALFEKWKKCLFVLIEDFLPKSIVEEMVELLLRKERFLFFSTPYEEYPELEVFKYNEDFELTIIKEIINILRYGVDRKDEEIRVVSKNLVIKGFRERFNLDDNDMTDQEVYDCFKALYDQPLMVEFCDLSYSPPMEYAVLKSKSLGFLLSHRGDAVFLKNISPILSEELVSFYELVPEDNIVFPYLHRHDDSVDVYISENIYVCGMYTSLSPDSSGYCDITAGGTLLVPSVCDVVLLKWADKLYDAIMAEREGCDSYLSIKENGE